MTAVRQSIAVPAVRDDYVQGVLALKAEQLGPTSGQLGIAGPSAPVSTWDLFVVWHQRAMMTMTPPGQSDRNAANSGPVFLPWHRFMMLLLELQFQRVLGNADFGLPCWERAADGDLPSGLQPDAPLWTATGIGGTGSPITDGPFAPDAFRVQIESDAFGSLRTTDRGLRREMGMSLPALPTTAAVAEALDLRPYDEAPWDRSSMGCATGWKGGGPGPDRGCTTWCVSGSAAT
jgi:tyrosinase